MDKTICYPGDTAWFRASIFDDNYPSTLSTTLYVELYDDSNKLCTRKVFPIISSVSIGQVELPRRSGLYWLRSYTRNSGFFMQSITIRSADPAVVIRKMLDDKELPVTLDTSGLFFNTVITAKGISSTIIPDSGSKYNDQPFKLLLKNYDSNAGEYTFTLRKYHQRNILINKDSIRGYLSLFFYNADTLVARQDIFVPEKNVPVELTKDTAGYLLTIKDSGNWNYSVAVVRAGSPDNQASILHCLDPPGKPRPTDTSFLYYKINVNSNSRRHSPIRSGDLAVMFQNDSLTATRLVPIDSAGSISLSGLYFFDTTYLHYRLNEEASGGEGSTVHLTLAPHEYPAFVGPDSSSYEEDTLNLPMAADLPDFDTVNYLKPAIVMPNWADRNKALDMRYTTGRFSNPTHYSFDLLHADTKYDQDIMDYLRKELPTFCGAGGSSTDTPHYLNKPVVFYLNEELMNWKMIPALARLKDIAYVKVLEDGIEDDNYIRMVSDIPPDSFPSARHPAGVDNHPRGMICIYIRKDADLRSQPGEMNTIAVKGYDRPLKWKTKDRATLFWAPYINRNTYLVKAPPSYDKPFKIIVEGVNRYGEVLHFEEAVDQSEKYSRIVRTP